MSALDTLYWPTLPAALYHCSSPVTYQDLLFQGKSNDRQWDKFRQQSFIDKNTAQ